VLMSAMKQEPESFDANFYLGKALYKKGGFDKAIVCFRKAKLIKPENVEVMEFIALCFYQMKKYKEALPFLKRVLDDKPDDKQLLFFAAISMTECGMGDKALKIFMHLRPNAQFGAQSCLEAGKMHERVKDYQAAIQDYSIALKLENIPEQIELQIRYRLANTYLAGNDIQKALEQLKSIQSRKSGYKDVDALVSRYQELSQNKNLQTYLISGTSDFVALCRKIITTYHSESFVKVEDISVASETVEIICFVESPKWSAKEIFRFYRSQTVMGDIYIREFHTKLRDTKCDLGICVTMGSFSEGAHKYAEGRPIDLIEKEQLTKILKKVNLLG
ncbi:MAG: tetratricopeptide repeat protein, partial [Treponema sp.]|nr:tetratricopeptide repeat protein [Treponema sp.]